MLYNNKIRQQEAEFQYKVEKMHKENMNKVNADEEKYKELLKGKENQSIEA